MTSIEEEFTETLSQNRNSELDLYKRLYKIIQSCVVPDHYDAVRKMLDKMSLDNPNLASALIYPLHLRRREISNLKPETENEKS